MYHPIKPRGRFEIQLTSFSTSYGFFPILTFRTDNVLKALEYSELIFRMLLEIDSRTTICRINAVDSDGSMFCHGYMVKSARELQLIKDGEPWYPLTNQRKAL